MARTLKSSGNVDGKVSFTVEGRTRDLVSQYVEQLSQEYSKQDVKLYAHAGTIIDLLVQNFEEKEVKLLIESYVMKAKKASDEFSESLKVNSRK